MEFCKWFCLILLALALGCKEPAPPAGKGGVARKTPIAPRQPSPAPSVGQMAMEIEGADLDGEMFRLTDYRGKVVMLDFWGDW